MTIQPPEQEIVCKVTTLPTEVSEAIQLDRNFLTSLINSVDGVVWSIMPETFQVLFISASAEKVYGWTPQEFYADSQLRMRCVHPRDQERYLEALTDLYDRNVIEIDYRIGQKSEVMSWLHDHIQVVRDAAGKVTRLNGVSVDITQHKVYADWLEIRNVELSEAYKKIEDTQSQLLQSEKMASIGQLAAGVAHEINNPIGYVNSNLSTLQKYLQNLFELLDVYTSLEAKLGNDPAALAALQAAKNKADLAYLKEDVEDLMNESREGIQRVKKIVQSLKDFSHVGETDEWQEADLRTCLDSTLNIVWNELKYKAEVIKDYGDIPDIDCLPSQLNQVFMNLLVNAAQAIETRGTVTIRTLTEGDHVIVEISDTGKGIAEEHLSRVFDPFFTTKPVGKGTGLGLSVSYSIIQKHNGTFTVQSQPGQGTTFRITLPIHQPEQGA